MRDAYGPDVDPELRRQEERHKVRRHSVESTLGHRDAGTYASGVHPRIAERALPGRSRSLWLREYVSALSEFFLFRCGFLRGGLFQVGAVNRFL
jgi:hypothetical protein